MSEATPPSAEALQKGAEGLKKGSPTKERANSSVDPAVIAAYKKVYADNGGDKDKVCAAFELDTSKWGDIGDADAFCMKYLGAK